MLYNKIEIVREKFPWQELLTIVNEGASAIQGYGNTGTGTPAARQR